jgi:hypothetical protein
MEDVQLKRQFPARSNSFKSPPRGVEPVHQKL